MMTDPLFPLKIYIGLTRKLVEFKENNKNTIILIFARRH
jgi:hypothetical protein